MSSNISTSMTKCMQSLISQVDGQKPVAGNSEVQYLEATGQAEGDKGDDDQAARRHSEINR